MPDFIALSGLLLVAALIEASLWALRGQTVPEPGPGEGTSSLAVIVAAHDEASRVSMLIESVLRQDHPDFVLVVVDDRSSDQTAAVATRAAGGDPRVTILRLDADRTIVPGPLEAHRLGVEASAGEWLIFLSADQVLTSPSFLRSMVSEYERKGLDAVSVMGPFAGDRWWERWWFQPILNNPLVFGVLMLAQRLRSDSAWLIGALGIRRSTYHELGGACAAAQAGGVWDDMGWASLADRGGVAYEFVYHPDLVDVNNWRDAGEFVQAMSRWIIGIAEFGRHGWLALGSLSLLILSLEVACLVAAWDLLSGRLPPPALLWVAALGPLIGWGYKRWAGAGWSALLVFYPVGYGVVFLVLAAALARLRGRVVWRDQLVTIDR